jgi:hypothetical protein
MRPHLLAVASYLLVASCARAPRDTREVTLEHAFAPLPATVGPLHVSLTLRDPAGRPVEGATLGLEGNMSHPGMVPVQAVVQPIAAGRYAGVLELTMAGDWFVRVWGVLEDGRPIDRTIPLRGVRAAQ